jgi:hypothetical protein
MAKSAPAIDRLYAALPAAFVKTRNALAQELTEAGRRREAAEVKRLRKPTVPVWALNRVAREAPASMRTFVNAVQELSKAQRRGKDVPAAMHAERDARQQVLARGGTLIADAALRTTPDVARRMSTTLVGAATDPHMRDRLLRGQLEEEIQASGFEQFQPLRVVRGSDKTSRRSR